MCLSNEENHSNIQNEQAEREISQKSDLEKHLENCNLELRQAKDLFVRLNADFDNYKKRTIKEKANWVVASQADLLTDLLNIVDDFDRAFIQAQKDESKNSSWFKGFELIYKSFYKFLDKHEVKEITDFTYFNPEYHEAIAQIESDNHKSGDIIDVAQKGFIFKDRVLRAAKVTVAK
jgi:molecular chaperone GrpE